MDQNAPMTIPPEPPHDVACSQGQNRCSDPCRRSYWLRWGERKPKAIVCQIFRERYPKQVLSFVKKVNTKGELETRTKGIVDKCSDLICTKKYALTEGPKRGGGFNLGHSLSPPSHFMPATGLKLKILASEIYQTKFTGSVSLVVFFKTVSFSVQVKLAHCPRLPLALIWNNRRAHQPWPFTLERVPPRH